MSFRIGKRFAHPPFQAAFATTLSEAETEANRREGRTQFALFAAAAGGRSRMLPATNRGVGPRGPNSFNETRRCAAGHGEL